MGDVIKRDIVGIDISAEELVFCQIKNVRGKKEFTDLLSYNIKDFSDDDIAQMLKNIFKDLKIRNPYVINVVPLHLTITKNLEIPSLDPKEINEIIDLQSGRQTPYAREEIIVDYINLGMHRQSYTKVLLVIVPRSAVKRQFEIMIKVGIRIEKMFFAPEGISTITYAHLNPELQDNPVGIVHIDSGSSDFIISLQGVPIFTRSIPIGASQILNEKDKFIDELKQSMETYHSEDIEKSPHMLLVTGATEQPPDFAMALTTVMHMPVKIIKYFDYLPLNEKITALPSIARHMSFFNVSSVIMNPHALKVNLLPEEIKLKRAFESRAADLIKMGVYVVCVFILLGGLVASRIYFRSTYLRSLRKQHDLSKLDAQVLEKSMEKVRVIKHYLKERGFSLQVLAAVYDILPKRILLDSIKMDQSGNLYLKGTARAMSDVFSFVVALEETEYFSNVQTNYTTSRKVEGEDRADFGIACILEESYAKDIKK